MYRLALSLGIHGRHDGRCFYDKMCELQRLLRRLTSGYHTTFSTYTSIAKNASTYVPVLAHYGGCMAVVWRLYGGTPAELARSYLHRVSSTNCKLKGLLYHHTAAQLLSYCSDIPDIVRWYWS